MKVEQESKFDAVDGRLVNRATGEPIPDDEPVFALRAKDYCALSALIAYSELVTDDAHRAAVEARIKQFRQFGQDNPRRMKLPDTAESCVYSAEGKTPAQSSEVKK